MNADSILIKPYEAEQVLTECPFVFETKVCGYSVFFPERQNVAPANKKYFRKRRFTMNMKEFLEKMQEKSDRSNERFKTVIGRDATFAESMLPIFITTYIEARAETGHHGTSEMFWALYTLFADTSSKALSGEDTAKREVRVEKVAAAMRKLAGGLPVMDMMQASCLVCAEGADLADEERSEFMDD